MMSYNPESILMLLELGTLAGTHNLTISVFIGIWIEIWSNTRYALSPVTDSVFTVV